MIDAPTPTAPDAAWSARLLRLGCRALEASSGWIGFSHPAYRHLGACHGEGSGALAALAPIFAEAPRRLVEARPEGREARALPPRGLAGGPIHDMEGCVVGTLVLGDRRARSWGPEDQQALEDLIAVIEEDLAATCLAEDAIAAQQASEVVHRLARDGFLVVGGDGTILAANEGAAALFGYPAFALAGRDIRWLLPGFASTGPRPGRDQRLAVVGRHRHGHDVPIETVSTVLEPRSGKLIMKLALPGDMRANADLADAIRPHLNAVIGYSEMLEDEAHALGQEAFAADVAKINRAGWRMLGLADACLAPAEGVAGLGVIGI